MSEPNQTQILNSCPECQQVIDVTQVRPYEKIICPHCQEAIRVRNAFNHFTILGELGEGGMSRVFQAQDNTLGREVALKILHTHFEDNSELQAQFEREAKVTASINHPNVVKVYSVGADQGYFFIAMELLETASLDHQISDLGKIEEVSAIRSIHEICQGLAAAYERGLIHRDIKPGNILVDSGGTAKLVDFGLALVQGEEEQVADLWATPFYVPPEKLAGKPEDFRSDIYSLGATLFHMVAGRPPCDANTNSIQELMALKAQPVNLKSAAPHVSSETVSLVHRMMANRPEMRQSSYAELLSDISRVRQKIDPSFEVASEGSRGGPLWLKLAGALLALGFMGGMGALLFAGREKVEKVEISNTGSAIRPGAGEVIVSAEETRMVRQLDTARKALAEGNRESARQLFTELEASGIDRADVKAWAEFHLGLLDLISDDEDASLAHFKRSGELAERLPEADKVLLKTAAGLFSEAGKVSYQISGAEDETGLALLYMPCGLKNWLHDDFRGALQFFDAYKKADFEVNHRWMGEYKARADPYFEDANLLVNLPPVREDMDIKELRGVLADLEKAKASLHGERGVSVLERRAAKAKKRIETLTVQEKKEAGARDRKRLEVAEESTTSFAAEMNFAQGAKTWRDLKLETDEGKKLSRSIAEGWELAAKFYPAFASGIGKYRYEGQIRRRTGRPFSARIVQADEQSLVVDLGFGPTTLKLATIEPGSILDIAKQTVIRDFDTESRQAAAFFAWLIGEKAYAQQIAESLYGTPGFPRRWEAVTFPPDL